jgi:hypothetical protein
MKLGMTGSRDGISLKQKNKLIEFLDNNTIKEAHHGDCLGADKEFHHECEKRTIKIIIHPPINNYQRAYCKSETILQQKDYIERNHDIVDISDLLIAFPSTDYEVLRSGTWATIRYAKKQNKKMHIIYPNGSISYHNCK